MEARSNMHHASAMAGMAFTNASLGLVHSLANAILLPHIIRFNRKETDKTTDLETYLEIDDLAKFIEEDKFKEVLKGMSQNAYDDPCTLTNPRKSDHKLVEMLYKASYYGNDIEE